MTSSFSLSHTFGSEADCFGLLPGSIAEDTLVSPALQSHLVSASDLLQRLDRLGLGAQPLGAAFAKIFSNSKRHDSESAPSIPGATGPNRGDTAFKKVRHINATRYFGPWEGLKTTEEQLQGQSDLNMVPLQTQLS